MSDLKYRIYTAKSETDKALNTLKGILAGIMIDQEVNEKEIISLYEWTKQHSEILIKNPLRELFQILQRQIAHKEVDLVFIDQLFFYCQKFEYENLYYNAVTSDIQTLMGVCRGIIADNLISDKEIQGLKIWLENHQHLKNSFPYDEVFELISRILSDGKLTEDEKLELTELFEVFLGTSSLNEGINQNTEKDTFYYSAHFQSFDGKKNMSFRKFCSIGKIKF